MFFIKLYNYLKQTNTHTLSKSWRNHPEKTHTILTSVRKTSSEKVHTARFSRSKEKLMD